jgi:hypothetical protein
MKIYKLPYNQYKYYGRGKMLRQVNLPKGHPAFLRSLAVALFVLFGALSWVLVFVLEFMR